jgi:hypothetical protein
MQTVIVNDYLLKNAAQCIGIEDSNEVITIALQELILHHQPIIKRRQPPMSIAGKAQIIGDLIEPCTTIEDIECLK